MTIRALIIGGSPGQPPAAAVLLRDADGLALSVVETAEVAAAILANQPFEAAVIDIAGDDTPSAAVNCLLRTQPDLVVVAVTETDQAASTLLALGAQEQLTRDDLTRSVLLRAVRHGIARRTFRGEAPDTLPERSGPPATPVDVPVPAAVPCAVPEVLLAQSQGTPSEAVVTSLAHLLARHDASEISLEDLKREAGDAGASLSLASRPLGNVVRTLIARDLDAQGMLVQGCFERATASGDLADAVTLAVQTFASFWGQAPPSVLLATEWGGLDDQVRELRYQHLRRLSDSAVRYLAQHRQAVAHEDPDRALAVAVDQLLAVLDQQLILGPLHPVDLAPAQVVASFAEQVTVFLRGPRRPVTAPEPAPATVPAGAAAAPATAPATAPPTSPRPPAAPRTAAAAPTRPAVAPRPAAATTTPAAGTAATRTSEAPARAATAGAAPPAARRVSAGSRAARPASAAADVTAPPAPVAREASPGKSPERPGSLFGRPAAASEVAAPTFDLTRIRIETGPRVEEANVRVARREPAVLAPT